MSDQAQNQAPSDSGSPLSLSAKIDLLLIFIVAPTGFLIAYQAQWYEKLLTFTRHAIPYALDQMALATVATSLAALYFAARRYIDMRREFRRRLESEKRFVKLSQQDNLTELSSRRRFNQQLEMALIEQQQTGADVAIMLIDLDRFKPVNDMHGHRTGDLLLKQVAERVQAEAKDAACVARFGGDEFALLIKNGANDYELEQLAGRILNAIEEPFDLHNIQCRISASFGMARAVADESLIAAELIERADLALYRSKSGGRGQFQLFRTEMDAHMRVRARLEIEMREAIKTREIKPHYQPLVHLADGRVEGFEILARWDHPVDGLIYPSVFIPIAEDSGQICAMSLSLLDQALTDAATWPEAYMLSLNISPVQLRDPKLCTKIIDILKTHDFAPERLEIEITENALIYDLEVAKSVITELKTAGIAIALDDFGTGYSSLHHLRELPFDRLKIDGSFIMNLQTSKESQKIVLAIIALGRSLGMKTTAEGIETLENAAWLTDIGCETGQGYLFGKPMSGSETLLRCVETYTVTRLKTTLDEMQRPSGKPELSVVGGRKAS